MSNENLTSNAENECSRVAAEAQPAVVNDNVELKSDSTETKKERETWKRSHAANRLETKSKETDSSKGNVKRRKTLEGHVINAASAEKKDETSDSLKCNGHQKAKRRLLDDGPPKKRVSSKKTKSCHENDADKTLENDKGVELSSKRTFKVKNGVEKKELKMSKENNLDYSREVTDEESEVAAGINSSASSDESSDDELLSDAFSPSQEASKFDFDSEHFLSTL